MEPLRADHPFYTPEEARQRYSEGKLITFVPNERPPAWSFTAMSSRWDTFDGDNYHVRGAFYTPEKTPLRQVQWATVEGVLVCRQVIDVFYPEGNPKRRVPFMSVVTVTQDFGTDGVALITVSSPLEEDVVREVSGVLAPTVAVPQFGRWEALVAASAPPVVERFGWDAITAAKEFADSRVVRGEPVGEAAGWRVAAGDRDLMAAIQAVVRGGRPRPGIHVLERGDVRILPLAAQSNPAGSGRDPGEERRRFDRIGSDVSDACEQYEGRPLAFDLAYRGGDRIAAYAAALRRAGATRVLWWAFEPADAGARGVTLVWCGDESAGDLTLAVQVVPVSWVDERRTKPGAVEVDLAWSLADVIGTPRA
ncbi:hypothetical protein [Microbacterium sp.]|uniref:hypothetical protein n=1 Tax=Microbacterium sp. TaxID=51671 RepID=UPI0039E52D10